MLSLIYFNARSKTKPARALVIKTKPDVSFYEYAVSEAD